MGHSLFETLFPFLYFDYTIYEENVKIKYSSFGNCFAVLYKIISILLILILPLIIAYFTGGFWVKETTYFEQPAVTFLQRSIVMTSGSEIGSEKIWTSSEYINNNLIPKQNFIFPLFQVESFSSASDNQINYYNVGDDDRVDTFKFKIKVPLSSKENVYKVKILLLFSYSLLGWGNATMESAVFVNFDSNYPGYEYNIEGDLLLKQNKPLHWWFHNVNYFNKFPKVSEFENIRSFNDLSINSILSNIFSREITTQFKQYNKGNWKEGPTSSQFSNEFNVNIKVNIPEQKIWVIPSFFYIIKMALIQYIIIALLILLIINQITRLIVTGGYLNTRIKLSTKKYV